jgi:hypothetical protein
MVGETTFGFLPSGAICFDGNGRVKISGDRHQVGTLQIGN